MYTIGDFLIQIQNAYMAHKRKLEYPNSKVVASIGKILEKEGYLGKITIQKSKETNREELIIELNYVNRVAAVSKIKLISKPSVHHYVEKKNLRKYAGRFGTSILSTSKGIMTGKEAQKQGLGGEVICQIF